MRVTYHGPHDGVVIPQLHQVVIERGMTIEVDDELGAGLIEQSTWDTELDEIAGWVGDDPDRAARLLAAERDGAGRDEVIAHLEQIANPQAVNEAYRPDAVPTGTVDEVLAWVGDDRDRAARALEVELSGKNRASLVAALSTKESD